jgi:GT2 family glycosyltransferase
MPPTVTAILLAYGAEPYLEEAVNAILASTGVTLDVVVVDNGCTSTAIDQIKGLAGVRVVSPPGNTGYAGGCAIGAADAIAEFLVFVNSDAIVQPEALARLVRVAAEPGVGLAMGSIRLASDPALMNTAGNPIHFVGLVWAGGYQEPATKYAVRRQVPSGSGCCFAIRRAQWEELGGFAAEYFAYHEDTELSVRLWQRGLTVEFVPDAVVVHHYEFSRNQLKSYLLERNRLILLFTTYQTRTLVLLAPMLVVTEVAMLAAAVLGRWGGAKTRGWKWIWRHRGWVRQRRARLQAERTEPDRALVPRMTGQFDASNVEAPPGIAAYNVLAGAYWAVARRLI